SNWTPPDAPAGPGAQPAPGWTMPMRSINVTRGVARWLATSRRAGRPAGLVPASRQRTVLMESPRRRRVLIVEDELALRVHYERHFSSQYQLVLAATGGEALERMAEEAPDIAVL